MEKTFLTCAIVVTTVSNFVAYRTEFRTYQKPISATAIGDLLQFLASNFQRVNEADYDIVARCFKCTGFIWIVNFIL